MRPRLVVNWSAITGVIAAFMSILVSAGIIFHFPSGILGVAQLTNIGFTPPASPKELVSGLILTAGSNRRHRKARFRANPSRPLRRRSVFHNKTGHRLSFAVPKLEAGVR
jgi:hypothetical protein